MKTLKKTLINTFLIIADTWYEYTQNVDLTAKNMTKSDPGRTCKIKQILTQLWEWDFFFIVPLISQE